MRHARFGLVFFAGLIVAAFIAAPALAQSARCHGGMSFERWLDAFQQKALAQGITRPRLAAASPYFTFDPGIVRKDRGQGVFQHSFLQFAGRMVNSRMSSGPAKMRQHAALLSRVEQQFGVPGAVVAAF